MSKSTEGLLRTIPGLGNIKRPAFERGIAMDEWEESKHPRAENGQFGSGGSNTGEAKVYHGTRQKFDDFDFKKRGKNYKNVKTPSAFFTESLEDAEYYTEEEDYNYNKRKGNSPRIIEAFVNKNSLLSVSVDDNDDPTNYIDEHMDMLVKKAKKEKKHGIYVNGGSGPGVFMILNPEAILSHKELKQIAE